MLSFTSGSMLYCVTQIACSGHMKLLLIHSKISSDSNRTLPAVTDWGLSTKYHFHLIPLDYFPRERKRDSRRKNEEKKTLREINQIMLENLTKLINALVNVLFSDALLGPTEPHRCLPEAEKCHQSRMRCAHDNQAPRSVISWTFCVHPTEG